MPYKNREDYRYMDRIRKRRLYRLNRSLGLTIKGKPYVRDLSRLTELDKRIEKFDPLDLLALKDPEIKNGR